MSSTLLPSPATPTARRPRPAEASSASIGPGFDLALALTSERGWPRQWRPAPAHPGLACAVIDAVMTPHVRSDTVAAVVGRYRRLHSEHDGPQELARSFDMHGERWTEVIGTRNRAWRSPRAPLKSAVIADAAHLLLQTGVDDIDGLREHAADPELRARWSSLPGQATGATWRHLLLVAGHRTPMICRLTRRFVRRHHPDLADHAADDELLDHMAAAARTLGVPVTEIDHQMWRAGARGAPRPPALSPAHRLG